MQHVKKIQKSDFSHIIPCVGTLAFVQTGAVI